VTFETPAIQKQETITDQQKRYWKYEYDVTSYSMLPLLKKWGVEVRGASVIDVGCGDGGGLCAFHDAGARCVGFDSEERRIRAAEFLKENRTIRFEPGNLYNENPLFDERGYDILYLHDVFEHLEQKELMLNKLQRYLKTNGRALVTFPPYYSAYGAHQQLLRFPLARIPFFHLIPFSLSVLLPRLRSESPYFVGEVKKLGRLKMGMRQFERIVAACGARIVARQAYLISPNHIRFGLKPVRAGLLESIPLINEIVCTGVVYLLARP